MTKLREAEIFLHIWPFIEKWFVSRGHKFQQIPTQNQSNNWFFRVDGKNLAINTEEFPKGSIEAIEDYLETILPKYLEMIK